MAGIQLSLNRIVRKDMKRDNEFLRELLFKIESNEGDFYIVDAVDLRMPPEERKEYHHIQLLCDNGYVVLTGTGKDTYRLTSQGHDFIEAIRDKGIWEKTKKAVSETGGNATLEMVKIIALGFLKEKLSKHTGTEL